CIEVRFLAIASKEHEGATAAFNGRLNYAREWHLVEHCRFGCRNRSRNRDSETLQFYETAFLVSKPGHDICRVHGQPNSFLRKPICRGCNEPHWLFCAWNNDLHMLFA